VPCHDIYLRNFLFLLVLLPRCGRVDLASQALINLSHPSLSVIVHMAETIIYVHAQFPTKCRAEDRVQCRSDELPLPHARMLLPIVIKPMPPLDKENDLGTSGSHFGAS
jgi:hypothetical protein